MYTVLMCRLNAYIAYKSIYAQTSERNVLMMKETINSELSRQQLEKELLRMEHRHKRSRAFQNTMIWLMVMAVCLTTLSVLWFPILWIRAGDQSAPEKGRAVLTMRTTVFNHDDLVVYYRGEDTTIMQIVGKAEDQITRDDQGDALLHGQVMPAANIPQELTVVPDNYVLLMDTSKEKVDCVPCDEIVGKVLLQIWPLPWVE